MNNDLIIRSALLEASKKFTRWFDDVNDRRCVERMIREAPAVDAEMVRHGRWIKDSYRTAKSYIRRCYACNKECYFCGDGCSYKYCPNCGARMD